MSEISTWDQWDCLLVSTHEPQKIISDEDIINISCLDDVMRVFRLGNYGMELIIIVDTADRETLDDDILQILKLTGE